MSSKLATIVRRLHPTRSGDLAGTLKLASVAAELEIDCQSRPGGAPVPAGAPEPRQLSVARSACEKPAGRLLESPIKFVGHPSFDDSTMTAEILGPMPGSAGRTAGAHEALHSRAGEYQNDAYLTREQEAHLFRKLNFLKYQAAQFSATIEPGDDVAASLDCVAGLLEEANAVQNRIIRSYLRLVASIVKSWIRPGDDFFELLSDGTVAMMRAMQCFDFARGRRFGTYATWVVTNEFARMIPRERDRRHRFTTGREGLLQLVSDHRGGLADSEDQDQYRAEIRKLLGRLTDREQTIISCRFGLTGDSYTLGEIGQELGITRERVRQIESRAMGKLRRFAAAWEREPAPGRPAASRSGRTSRGRPPNRVAPEWAGPASFENDVLSS
jgi:RNA polymerase primary sigma factor